MRIIDEPLEGCLVLEPTVFADGRGYFYESFNEEKFNQLTGQTIHFVQDNQSLSSYGVVRGLHFQRGEHAQAKLVRVLRGRVLDVALDLRPASATFGQHFALELSAENHLQLFIPRGFAHGFAVLSQEAEFFYKCDNYYHKASEGGIAYDDAALAIDWGVASQDRLISDKDLQNPTLAAYCQALEQEAKK